MNGKLLKYNNICILLYQGNVAASKSLFKQMFHAQDPLPMKDLIFCIQALNLSIYYYILSKESVSLDTLCLEHRTLIENCPCQFESLYQLGLRVIHQYGYCKEYLIERHTNEHVKNILRYIHKHLGDSLLSLESISKSIGLAKHYVAQLFKQETHKTIHEYIMEERLKLSTILLKQKHLPISNIAEICGFNSTTYYSTAFKHKYQVSPKQYQKHLTIIENQK